MLAALVRVPSSSQERQAVSRKQGVSAVHQVPKERPSRPLTLLDIYLQTLHELHAQEEEALRQQHTPSLAQTLLPLMHSNYIAEENVLAHAHSLTITKRHVHTERHLQRLRQFRTSDSLPLRIDFPNYPFWCEWFHTIISGYWRQHIGLFGFRVTSDPRPLHISTGGNWTYRSFESTAPWLLDIVDEHGTPVLRLLSKTIVSTGETVWGVDPSHLCPTQTCLRADSPTLGRATVQLCTACLREAQFWSEWTNALLALAFNQSLLKSRPESLASQEPVSHLEPQVSEENTITRMTPPLPKEVPGGF